MAIVPTALEHGVCALRTAWESGAYHPSHSMYVSKPESRSSQISDIANKSANRVIHLHRHPYSLGGLRGRAAGTINFQL